MLYYNQYSKCFAVDSQEENDHFCLFVKTEKGRFNVDLLRFMPCTKKQFCMLLDIVAEDLENERRHVATLHEFIFECASILEKFRNGYSDSAQKAKYTSMINKWNTYYNELARRYSLEEKTDPEAATKCKKVSVVPFIHMAENEKPKILDGWQFKKYGMQFYVYKNPRSKTWYTIVPFCGLACNSGYKNKNAAIESITPELIKKLQDVFPDAETAEAAKKRYLEYLQKHGLDYILEDPLYNLPEFEKPEEVKPEKASQPEEAKTTIDGSNFDEYGAKDPETGEVIPLCYNANDGYIYAVVNGTIYSTCKYKNHKPLYNLEVIPLATCRPPEDTPCKRENALKRRYVAIKYTLSAASRNGAKMPYNATYGAIKSACKIDRNGAIINYISSLYPMPGNGCIRRKTALQYTALLLHAIQHGGGVTWLYLPRLEVFKPFQGGGVSGSIQRSNIQAAYNDSS